MVATSKDNQQQLPPGYHVGHDLIATSRWIVSYKGDPFLFVEKVNALGETRIKTFKTKKAAIQAVIDHVAYLDRLEAPLKAAQKAEARIDRRGE
jgi:hypothetical protein